ncbi:MAG: hypothetical protein V7K58_26685 [Nostoc sp.]
MAIDALLVPVGESIFRISVFNPEFPQFHFADYVHHESEKFVLIIALIKSHARVMERSPIKVKRQLRPS